MSGYQHTLARDERGGYVALSVYAVHAHECPYWRIGKRHGPCNCGAIDLWMERAVQREVERAEKRHGAMP